mgnify:CR=1 FL=1
MLERHPEHNPEPNHGRNAPTAGQQQRSQYARTSIRADERSPCRCLLQAPSLNRNRNRRPNRYGPNVTA